MAGKGSQRDTYAGAAVYSPVFLQYIYDFWVLRICSTYAWRCSTQNVLLPFFNRHVSKRHIDIGVGSGYYPSNACLQPDSHLTLVDLNPNTLAAASSLLKQKPRAVKHDTIQADVLSPQPLPLQERLATSISVMYLLHCLPGPPARKAAALIRLRDFLTPDGVLFGATVLGNGAPHNLFGRVLMTLYNWLGAFGNANDAAKDFVEPLEEAFDVVEWRIEGVVLLFEARSPRF